MSRGRLVYSQSGDIAPESVCVDFLPQGDDESVPMVTISLKIPEHIPAFREFAWLPANEQGCVYAYAHELSIAVILKVLAAVNKCSVEEIDFLSAVPAEVAFEEEE